MSKEIYFIKWKHYIVEIETPSSNVFNYKVIDTQFVQPYHQIVVGQKKI